MASGGTPIGEIPVLITGDWSELDASLKQATAAASSGADQIASAFNTTASAAGTFGVDLQRLIDQGINVDASLKVLAMDLVQTGAAFQQQTAPSQQLAESIKKVGDYSHEASGNAEKLAAIFAQTVPPVRQLSDAAQSLVDKQRNLNDQVDKSRAVWAELSAAYARGAASTQDVARAEKELEDSLKKAGQATQEASGWFDGLASKIPGVNLAMGALAAGGAVLIADKLKDIAAAAIHVGETFEQASVIIQRATGASGESLRGMEESFNNLYRASALGGDEIAKALGKMQQETHAEGAELEALTLSVMNFTKVAGGSLYENIDKTQQIFAAWQVQTSSQSAALDMLYIASRQSGMAIGEITGAMERMAPVLNNLGFSFKDSVALIGAFDAAGLHAVDVTQALNQAFGKLAKAGGDPAEALRDLIEEVKEAATRVDALNILIDAGFNEKIAGKMVNAIKSGAFELAGFTEKLNQSAGAVDAMAHKTTTLTEEWAKLGHGMSELLSGPATGFVKFLGDTASGLNLLIDLTEKGRLGLKDFIPAAIAALSNPALGAQILTEAALGGASKTDATPDQYAGWKKQAAQDALSAAPAGGGAGGPRADLAGLKALQAQFESLSIASTELLTKVRTDYADYISTLDTGGATAATLLKNVTAEINKAETAIANPAMPEAIRAKYVSLIATLTDMQGVIKKFADTDEVTKMALKVEEIAKKYPQQVAEMTGADKAFLESMHQIALAAPEAFTKASPIEAIKATLEAQKKLDEAAEKTRQSNEKLVLSLFALNDGSKETVNKFRSLANSELNLTGITGSTAKGFEDMALATWGLAPASQAVAMDAIQFGIALKQLGIDSDGVTTKIAAVRVGFETLANSSRTTLPEMASAWDSLLVATKKAAEGFESVDDLISSKLFKDMQDGISKLNDLGAPIGDIIAKQEAGLQLIIDVGKRTGESVGVAVFELEKLKLKQQEVGTAATAMSYEQGIALASMNEAMLAHRDVVNIGLDSYVHGLKLINQGLYDMGVKLVENYFKGQNLFKGLGQMAIKLGEQILEDLVGRALKALGETLVGLITGGNSALAALMKGAGGTAQAAAEAATKAAKASADAAKSAAEAAKSIADNGAKMATQTIKAASSLMSAVDTIADVVTAIASVVQVIELKQVLGKLKYIEENTRISAIVAQQQRQDLWDQHLELSKRVIEVQNAVLEVSANIGHFMEGLGMIFDRLGDMWNTLQDIATGQDTLVHSMQAIVDAINSASARSSTSFAELVSAMAPIITDRGGSGGSTGPSPKGETGTTAAGFWGPTASIIASQVTLIATNLQYLADLESQVSADVKRLALEESLVAAGVAGLAVEMAKVGAHTQPIAADLTGLSTNIHDVSDHLQNVSDTFGFVANNFGTLVNDTTQTKIDTSTIATYAGVSNAILDSINKATGQTYAASSSTASNTAKAAATSAAAAESGFKTMQQMGIQTVAEQGIQLSTDAVATSTAAVATTTSDMSAQLESILIKLGEIDNTIAVKSDALFNRLGDMWGTLQALLKNTYEQLAAIYIESTVIRTTLGGIWATLQSIDASTKTMLGIWPKATKPPDVVATLEGLWPGNIGIGSPTNPPTGNRIGIPPLMPTGAMSVPTPTAITGTFGGVAATSNTVSVGAITINVNGSQSPRQTAEAVWRELRVRLPQASAAATR